MRRGLPMAELRPAGGKLREEHVDQVPHSIDRGEKRILFEALGHGVSR